MTVLLRKVLFNQSPVGCRENILFAAEILRVTTQVDQSLSGANTASCVCYCLPDLTMFVDFERNPGPCSSLLNNYDLFYYKLLQRSWTSPGKWTLEALSIFLHII